MINDRASLIAVTLGALYAAAVLFLPDHGLVTAPIAAIAALWWIRRYMRRANR